MSEVLTKLVHDCETNTDTIVPLTEEEILQLEADRKAFKDAEDARIAAEQAFEALKASARAKLIAGEPLTPEEAATVVI